MRIQITQKPFNVSSNSRVLYKIIQLLLILYFSRGKKAPLSKIHLLVWVLDSKNRIELLLSSKKLDYSKSIGLWGIDKNTNKALLYMFEDELCDISKKTYSLTDKGKEFIEEIIKNKEIFLEEKKLLKEVGVSLIEANIKKLENIWVM